MASVSGFGLRPLRAVSGSSSSSASSDDGFVTLTEYVGKEGMNVKDDLVVLLDHIHYACNSPFNYSLGKLTALRPALHCQIYSVNDARYFDWPEGLRQYIDTVRHGKGRYPRKYSARYICSLVADLYRTLLYGGEAMNPRDHLRLVYKANPLSFIVEQAGGRGSDGKSRIFFPFNQLNFTKDFLYFWEAWKTWKS